MSRDFCFRDEMKNFKVCHVLMYPDPQLHLRHPTNYPSHHQKCSLQQCTWGSPSKIPKFNPQLFPELLLRAKNSARGCDRQKEDSYNLCSQGTYSTDGSTSRVPDLLLLWYPARPLPGQQTRRGPFVIIFLQQMKTAHFSTLASHGMPWQQRAVPRISSVMTKPTQIGLILTE